MSIPLKKISMRQFTAVQVALTKLFESNEAATTKKYCN